MSSRARRFFKRSRSNNMFDPQRLLYMSTRTQKKARVLHPKSVSVSVSAGVDDSQRNEVFDNIISTRSYIFRPMTSSASSPWQSFEVENIVPYLITTLQNTSTIFNITNCSFLNVPDNPGHFHPFRTFFDSFYPNSPFPLCINMIKLWIQIPLKDSQSQSIYPVDTHFSFAAILAMYSGSNDDALEIIGGSEFTYDITNDDSDLTSLDIEIPLSFQRYSGPDSDLTITSVPYCILKQGHQAFTQSSPIVFDTENQPVLVNYINEIVPQLNDYRQYPSTYPRSVHLPLCTNNLDITTTNYLGLSIINGNPELNIPVVLCHVLLCCSDFAGIPAPRS